MSEPTVGVMTVCHDCKWHSWIDCGSWAMTYHRDTWWNNICTGIERAPAVDPTTGKRVYAVTNDLGKVILTDEPHPYCREVNPSGSCPIFERRIA